VTVPWQTRQQGGSVVAILKVVSLSATTCYRTERGEVRLRMVSSYYGLVNQPNPPFWVGWFQVGYLLVASVG
jgi:hypothetical protein